MLAQDKALASKGKDYELVTRMYSIVFQAHIDKVHHKGAFFSVCCTTLSSYFSLDAVLLGGGLDSSGRGIVEHPQTNPPTLGTLQAGLQEQNGQERDK